jgi:hypothetical protein
MNYRQLVLSHNPTGYINYDTGTEVDLVGVLNATSYTTGLNPTYDHTAKAHGMRSKRIGSNGNGNYDSLRLSDGSRNSYVYAEAWVYIPTGTSPNFNIWQAGGPTTPSTNSSYFGVTSDKRFFFYTSNGSLGGANVDTFQTAANIVPTGQWFHAGAKYDNGFKTIYLNGVPIATKSASATILNGSMYNGSVSDLTVYIDEFVLYTGDSSAIFPTDAQILARATFPRTKTKVWDATNGFWISSGDEQYWNGTQWVSMQDLPYKVWNGTGWVTV